MAVGATMADDLQFQGVVKRFGAFTAVRNLDLTIKGGEFFCFLGPSGCGKTTILRTVSGFFEPSEGDGPDRRPGHARHRPQQAGRRRSSSRTSPCSR